jgi:tetratricopeptide (TPR) repeat protein
MGRHSVFILVTTLFICSQAFATPLIKSVAITDFTANGFTENQSWIGESCANVIIDRISSDHTIRIVERAQLNRIIEELKLQMGGLVNSDAVVETGNLIGVTYFITGSISLFEDQIILSSRVFSVETGEIISTNTVRGLLKDLFNLQERLSVKICDDMLIKIQVGGNSDKPLENFELYSKIGYLRKMSETLPRFTLDPRRKIRINEYLNSVQQCDDLIKINPGYYLTHYYRGLFAMHLEEYEIADRETNIAVKLAPDNFEPLFLRVSVLINSGKLEEAKQILELMSTKFPDQPEGWFMLAKVQSSENEPTRAAESLIRSLLGKYIIPQALTNLRSDLSVSLPKTDDFSTTNIYNIARLFSAFWSKAKEPGDIVLTAEKVNQEFPGLFLPYFFMARSEIRVKHYQQAIDALQDCLSFYPDFPEAHREMALCYFNINQCDKADQHVKLYLQLSDAVNDYSVLEDARKKCK